MKVMPTKFDMNLCGRVDLENASIDIELRRNAELVSMWVVRTREELIRQGLIKLGWTPPLAKVHPCSYAKKKKGGAA
jgi:hypothetical protein